MSCQMFLGRSLAATNGRCWLTPELHRMRSAADTHVHDDHYDGNNDDEMMIMMMIMIMTMMIMATMIMTNRNDTSAAVIE